MSHVCMAAALHFDLSVHNFGIQEYMHHSEETERVFSHSYSFSGDMMHPGDAPGLGVDIDEALASKYPYRRTFLHLNLERHLNINLNQEPFKEPRAPPLANFTTATP